MDLQKCAEKAADYIRKCNNIIHIKSHELAKSYNLTIDQYHMLFHIKYMESPPSIGDLAKKYNKAQNTISEKTSRLEEKGLVYRKSDMLDRRVCRVYITGEGKKLVNTIRKEKSNKVIFSALNNMKEKEVTDLMVSLKKLLNYLEKEE